MKRYFIIPILYFFISTILLAQTSLHGKVTEEDNGEPVLFGNVALYMNGILITGKETDFDGNYSFSNIEPGIYDVEASYVGLRTQRITEVVVLEGKTNTLDIQMGSGGIILSCCMGCSSYIIPLIEKDNTTSGRIITSRQIRNSPNKSVKNLSTTVVGVSAIDQ